MDDQAHWNQRYVAGDIPWETGRPSSRLVETIATWPVPPGRALELGCGLGANAVWLARQGFRVTAIDISPAALATAQQRAATAGVAVNFLNCDILGPWPAAAAGPFDFFFDRGCYHAVRRRNVDAYLAALVERIPVGGRGLVLCGNAREPSDPGPPVVSDSELHDELGRLFEIVALEEFRFDATAAEPTGHLAWAVSLIRRPHGHLTRG